MSGYPETWGDVDANLFTVKSGVLKFGADTDGNVRAGSNVSAAATTAWMVFAIDQTYNSESMGAGDMLLGDNSTGKANILWDASEGKLNFRSGTTVASYIDTDGTLVTVDASIGGWVVGANSIKDIAGAVGLSSAVTGGDDTRIWAGNTTPASAPFYVTEAGALVATSATISGSVTATSGTIAGWTIDADEIKKLTANVGIILDSTTPIIKVGDTAGTHIQIDGANKRIRSSNYVAGSTGFNIDADTGDSEFGKITARGEMLSAVMVNTAVGETLIILPADVLDADMTAADNSTLTIKGKITLAVGDILWMKDETDEEWLEVTNIGSAPTYTVTRDKAAAYAANSNPAWKAGQAVVNYLQSGDGGIKIESGATPKISCFTHAGSPWTTITEQAYLGEVGVSAGKGAVALDENGLSLTRSAESATVKNTIRWVDSSGNENASIRCATVDYSGLTQNILFLATRSNNTDDDRHTTSIGAGFPNEPVVSLTVDTGDGATITPRVWINNNSVDADTIIEGDNATIATFDAGLDAVGFGGAAESGKIAKFTGDVHITGATNIDGALVVNEDSADVDTRIESNGNANAIFVDAGNDRVGIMNGSPTVELDVTGAAKTSGNMSIGGFLNLGSPTTLTISGGVVTATRSFHNVDTEGAAATDNLDTINGGTTGDILILRTANNARDVTVKDGTGNLLLAGDMVLDNAQDTITLLFTGTNWQELCRSNNA